jgi:hypothetical protein
MPRGAHDIGHCQFLPIRVDQVILPPFGRNFDSLRKRADVLAADTID